MKKKTKVLWQRRGILLKMRRKRNFPTLRYQLAWWHWERRERSYMLRVSASRIRELIEGKTNRAKTAPDV